MNLQQYHMQSRTNIAPSANGMPRPTGDHRIQAMFNLGLLDPRSQQYRLQQQQQPAGGVMREAPQSWQGVSMGQYRLPELRPPQLSMIPGVPSGAMSPQPGTMATRSRRRRSMGYRFPQRDVNGNLPGEWDYQLPPETSQPPMQLYGRGTYGQPQPRYSLPRNDQAGRAPGFLPGPYQLY